MKTNSFGKTLFFALLISASGMIVSCAGGEGTEETPAADTTAVAPVVETPVVEETPVVDSTATATDSTVTPQ